MSFFAHDKINSILPVEDWGRKLLNEVFKYDKAQHLAGSFLLAVFAGAYFPPLFAVGFSLMLGILWEVKDSIYEDGFSYLDLLADLVGNALYFIIMWRYW
jgi:hypothetical protein